MQKLGFTSKPQPDEAKKMLGANLLESLLQEGGGSVLNAFKAPVTKPQQYLSNAPERPRIPLPREAPADWLDTIYQLSRAPGAGITTALGGLLEYMGGKPADMARGAFRPEYLGDKLTRAWDEFITPKGEAVANYGMQAIAPQPEAMLGPRARALQSALFSASPTLAGMLAGPAGMYAGSTVGLLGQTFAGTDPRASFQQRETSTIGQGFIEQLSDPAQAALFASKLHPALKGPAMFLSELAINPIEEGLQKGWGTLIEQRRRPTMDEMVSEGIASIEPSLYQSLLMGGAGALMSPRQQAQQMPAQELPFTSSLKTAEQIAQPPEQPITAEQVAQTPIQPPEQPPQIEQPIEDYRAQEPSQAVAEPAPEIATQPVAPAITPNQQIEQQQVSMQELLHGKGNVNQSRGGYALPTPEQYRSILNVQTEESARTKATFEEGMRQAIEADARRAAERGNIQSPSEIPYPTSDAETQRLKLEVNQPTGQYEQNAKLADTEQQKTLSEKYGLAAGGGNPETTRLLADAAELADADWIAAKRGVVPHQDTQNAAEALAARTGMSSSEVEQMLAKGGQPAATLIGAGIALNRKQAVAAIVAAQNKDLMGMLNNTVDMLNTTVGVRAAVSEQARALGYYGWAMKKGAEAMGLEEAMAKTRKSTEKQGKPITPEQVTDILGGKKEVERIMDSLSKPGINLDAYSRFMHGLAGRLAETKTRTIPQTIMAGTLEYWKANILSGLFTQEVNVTGNGMSIALEQGAIKPFGAVIGQIRGKGANLADQKAALQETTKMWGNVLAMAQFAAKQEYPGKQLRQLVTLDPKMAELALNTLENKWRNPSVLPGAAGRLVRNYGYTPLGVEDAIAKAIVYQMELARNHGNIAEALREADRQTFNEQLTGLNASIANGIHGTPLEFVIPFTKTLTNLVKAGLKLTPGVNLMLPSYREELQGKQGASRQNDAIARMAVGSGIAALVAALHGEEPDDEGKLSGLGPATGARRKIWLQENAPIGLNVGGDAYPLYRFDPFSTTAGVDMAILDAQRAYRAWKNGDITEEEYVQRNTDAAKSVSRVVLDKHFMSNVAGILESLSEPSRIPSAAKHGMTNFATGMIPMSGMMGQTAQILDPYKRQPEGFAQSLQSRIPGMRQDLAPMSDVWGQPVEEPRYHAPFPTQAVPRKGDPVNREMLKLGIGMSIPKWMDALPATERRDMLQERRQWFAETISDPGWAEMGRDERRAKLRSLQSKWSAQYSDMRGELKAAGKLK